MITDKLNAFSERQVVTATAVSTNVIDLGPLGGSNTVRDIGEGEPVNLFVRVGSTAFAGGTSLQAVLETSLAEGSGYTTLASGPVVPLASLTAGARVFEGPIPKGVQRYLRVNYVVVGTMSGGGNLNAGLVETLQGAGNQFSSGFTLDT
jgi:hypothetical protein